MKNVNYIITEMNRNEVDDIVNLQLNNNNVILSKFSISTDMNNENVIYFIAKTENKIIGYIAATLSYDHIDILSILVDNNYTRNGVASSLLSSVINHAKENNIHDILLEVRAANIPAQKLYEKLNFNKISIRKEYYTDNLEDALVYKLYI
jgi:ribosomal-protein-alanine N-acetyltransferase